MENKKSFFRVLFTFVILVVMMGQRAFADNGWDIQANTNSSTTTFTITRSNTAVAETVRYRFVNLSAYAGQHYNVTKVNGENSNALSGEFTFTAGDTESRTIIVTETNGSGAYAYYKDDVQRSYKLEITDAGGFELASNTRRFTKGTSINSSNVYAEKSVTVNSGTITVTDGGFKQAYHAIQIDDYYTAAAPKAYLLLAGAELRMKVEFEEAEYADGYQHIQFLVNKTTSFDDSADGANPGTPTNSHYLASFAHDPGDKNTTYAKVCLPLTTAGNNCSAIDPAWNFSPYNNTVGKLYTQKFKSGYRADDGKLIIAKSTELSNLSTVGIRFDASGDNSDTWYAKSTVAKIQAADNTYPTKLAVSVAPGYHAKGNILYVSVAFSEIVTISGTIKRLRTSWGDLDYEAGSGTNVLTFSGKINSSASGSLSITGLTGTVQDLASKGFTWSGTDNPGTSLDDTYTYSVSYNLNDGNVATGNPITYTYETATITLNNPTKLGYYFDGWTGSNGNTPQTTVIINTQSHGNKSYTANWTQVWTGSGTNGDPYTITNKLGLDLLAQYVNSGNDCNKLYFQLGGDIDYTYSSAWNSSSSRENNYTVIGTYSNPFKGTFDGQGHTVSGIRIYCNEDIKGLFGSVEGGTVKRVNLSDARITAKNQAGGIVGTTFQATIKDCIVGADVCIHTVDDDVAWHGGIVGMNQGSISRCISHATLSVANGKTGCKDFGGIVGYNNVGTITDCIADGAVIPNVYGRGAIVGFQNNIGSLTRNSYHDCTVAGTVNATGVGKGNSEFSAETSDVSTNQGALPLYAVTLPEHASLVRSGTDLPGTNNRIYTTGVDIGGVPYAYATATLRLSYSTPSGYVLSSIFIKETASGTAVAVTDNGNNTFDFTMPEADVTVNAILLPLVTYIDADGNEQSHVCTPIESGTFTYGNSANAEGWYCVNSDVTLQKQKYVEFMDKAVNIILCDGATLTINYDGYQASTIIDNGSLTIYGQSLGTGSIVVSNNFQNGGYAIEVKNSIDINGGIISATSQGSVGISSGNQGITIRRGTVTAQGCNQGIKASGYITILGGNVTATGSIGIKANGTITLGCTTMEDRITASCYECLALTIADGQLLTDGTTGYSGIVNENTIGGKTLYACLSFALPPYVIATGILGQAGTTAYALPGVTITLSAATGYTISDVTVNGTLVTDNGGTWTFIMPASNATVSAMGTAHTYTVRFNKNNGDAIGTMSDQSFTYDIKQALYTNGFSLIGKTFIGWSTTADGVVEFVNEQPVWKLTAQSGGIIELYAVWSTISVFTGFTVTSGQEGSWTAKSKDNQSGTRYEKLVDEDKNTPWLTVSPSRDGFRNLYIEFNHTEPIVPKGYILTTGADVENNPCRNPKSWTLKGKMSNSDDWMTIATVTNDTRLPATNTTDVLFSLEDNEASYKYYRFEITAIQGNQSNGDWTMELGELQIVGFSSNSHNMDNCIVSGLEKKYYYYGNEINYSYTILDSDKNRLTEGTDYITIINKEGVEVSMVREPGEYTLTFVGNVDSGYYGLKTISFTVISSIITIGEKTYYYSRFFTPTSGQEGSWTAKSKDNQSGTRYEKLVDEDKNTPWLTVSPQRDGFRNLYIEFNHTEPFVPKGYILTTGADVENNPCRNPKSWTLKGKMSNSDEWTTIATVTNDTRLPATNTTDVLFSLEDNEASYKYYRFEITAIQGQQSNYDWTMELGELQLIGYNNYVLEEETGVTNLESIGKYNFTRSFTVGKASTICLPFPMTSITGGNVYTFTGIDFDDVEDEWVATMTDATPNGSSITTTVANTPYLFMPDATGEVTFSGTVENVPANIEAGSTVSTDTYWTFYGTYSRVYYGIAPMTGHVYGFASKDKTVDGHDVVAGQFVRAKSGAYVPSFRAYLTYTGNDDTFCAPSRDGNRGGPELPDRIKVRLLSSGGMVTAVGTLDTVTGDVTIERWFDMSGRPVDGEPGNPGLYINNAGRKILIK